MRGRPSAFRVERLHNHYISGASPQAVHRVFKVSHILNTLSFLDVFTFELVNRSERERLAREAGRGQWPQADIITVDVGQLRRLPAELQGLGTRCDARNVRRHRLWRYSR